MRLRLQPSVLSRRSFRDWAAAGRMCATGLASHCLPSAAVTHYPADGARVTVPQRNSLQPPSLSSAVRRHNPPSRPQHTHTRTQTNTRKHTHTHAQTHTPTRPLCSRPDPSCQTCAALLRLRVDRRQHPRLRSGPADVPLPSAWPSALLLAVACALKPT